MLSEQRQELLKLVSEVGVASLLEVLAQACNTKSRMLVLGVTATNSWMVVGTQLNKLVVRLRRDC